MFRELLNEEKMVGDTVRFKVNNMEWSGVVKKLKGKNTIAELDSDQKKKWDSVMKSDPDNVILYKNDIIG